MRKLFITILLVSPLLPFFQFNVLVAQVGCDHFAATKAIALAQKTYQTEQFGEAPAQILSALPMLEKCPDANDQKAAIYEQAGAWFLSLEKFELADVHLKKALELRQRNAARTAEINLLQARLALSTRNLDNCKAALDAVFKVPARLDEALYAEAWILRAKWFYFQTKPEQGMACLDSVWTFSAMRNIVSLQAEAWITRVELDLITGDFKHGIMLADTALAVIGNTTEPSVLEIQYRLLETSARMARGVVGIDEGHDRFLRATALAASMPPYMRVRCLPSAMSMSVFSYFEQGGEEAMDSIFTAFENRVDPERFSHRAFQAEAYTQHARALNSLGQFDQAIAFCERSNAILKTMPGNSNQRISANYLFMSAGYRLVEDLESAVRAGETALALREKEQPGFIGLGAIYNEILMAHILNNDTANVKATLMKFEQLVDSQKDQSNLEQYRLPIAFGWLEYWQLVGQPLKGIEKAEIFLKVSGPKARMRGMFTTDMEYRICDAYRDGGKYREAFDRLEPIVQRFKKRYQESGSIFYEHYSWVLAQSAYNALVAFENLGDSTMLQTAETRCAEAEDLLFTIRQRDPHEGQRTFVTDEHVYKSLMRVRAALFQRSGNQYHVERAFAVSESFQLVDIQRLLTENQALNYGGVSPIAAKSERDLQKQLAGLEAEKSTLRFEEPGPETDRKAASIELRLATAHQKYDSLLQAMERQFPDYYQLKYKLPVRSLSSVQKEVLKPNQCFLKIYAFNEEAICLLVRPDTSLILVTNFNETVQSALLTFLDGLQKYPEIAALPEADFTHKQQAFTNAAANVYTNLLAPVAPWLLDEIILAPADIFKIVPFEALLMEPTTQLARPSAWHYWGNEKTISYASSATIFQFVQLRPALRSDLQNALVMAPYFSGDLKAGEGDDLASRVRADFFTPLPHTGEEAAAVALLLDGTAFAGSQCAIGDFLSKAENYHVLHLATHASAGGHGRPAFISFQPANQEWRSAMLFESDIYALRLSADLVTLSACETALGKTRYGDGLQGLTRAFTCAGARNIVASLWTVNDSATKDLMIGFYQEIKLGLPYNQALAKAKRSFVQEHRSFGHPYYWAGFVLNGR